MARNSRSMSPKPPPLRVVEAARRPTAPDHLSDAMKAWWTAVLEDYDLDAHHRLLLQAACEAWDRMCQAREALAQHGLTYEDDRGAPKARPARRWPSTASPM